MLWRRPLSMALLLGAFVSFAASGRLGLRLLLGGALAWGFLPLLQVAWVAVARSWLAHRPLPLPQAVDLHSMGHGPWSLCLLGLSALTVVAPPESYAGCRLSLDRLLLLAVPFAFAWSAVIAWAFLRHALQATGRGAWMGLLLHSVFLYGSIVAFYMLSGQLWPRVLGLWR
jgi:hypothetical protein